MNNIKLDLDRGIISLNGHFRDITFLEFGQMYDKLNLLDADVTDEGLVVDAYSNDRQTFDKVVKAILKQDN